jgi:predicted site-specific integrase-resolvase
MRNLLTPSQVDAILQYPSGRSARLARAGKMPCVLLPDGEIRIPEEAVERIVNGEPTAAGAAETEDGPAEDGGGRR